MNTEPKLVDYSLIKKPEKIIKVNKKVINKIKKSDNSLMINFLGILVIGVILLMMYQRLIEKDKKEIEKQNIILGFHQYVNDKIK
tara:strand:+ start:222 stop:476 length:255 start_codon:yes stop_codon:yes gene_type:complete